MAKTIATIGGIGLAPGVSKNRRLYTARHIADAVGRAQARLKAGSDPMIMLTHHQADDDSRAIAASLTGISLDEDGRLRWKAGITDTPAGHDIASLADTTDGQPAHLDGVSIRGHWLGTVRKVKGPDGEPVETADGLEIDGLDFTRKPGVPDARIDTFSWADRAGQHETTERVLITESVQEARVTAITEESAAAPGHVFENGLCGVCVAEAKDPKKPYGDVAYADPGYQADKVARYPVHTKGHAKSAWSYINKASNAKKYTGAQLKRIKGRIKAALGKHGVKVADEGWTIDPSSAVTEAVAGCMEMGGPGGTFCVEASNGPICIRISSYSVDPADLDLILRNACEAADVALKSFDPDMDADIDLPGAGDISDPDGDAGESAAEGDGLEEATEDPAPDTAAVTTDSKEPVMAETATQEAGQALAEAQIPASAGDPGPTGVRTGTNNLNNNDMARNSEDDVAGNSFEQFLNAMIGLIASQAASDGKMNPAYTQLATQLIMSQRLGMSGPQAAASVAATGAGSVPAPPVSAESAPGGTVAETEAQMVERIVAAKLAAASPAPVEETAEQRIERLVNERLATEKAALTESGQGPTRKGLVAPVRESAANDDYSQIPADWPQKPLSEYTQTEWKTYVEPQVAGAVFGARGAKQPA